MHPAEKTKYASVLRSEPTLDEKRVTLKNIRAYRKEGG